MFVGGFVFLLSVEYWVQDCVYMLDKCSTVDLYPWIIIKMLIDCLETC